MARSAAELEREFTDLGIDPSRLEFYNLAAFKRAEENDSSFLESYAEYVAARQYSDSYLEWVRATLPEIAGTAGVFAKKVWWDRCQEFPH